MGFLTVSYLAIWPVSKTRSHELQGCCIFIVLLTSELKGRIDAFLQ
jgi:hypothetical protein